MKQLSRYQQTCSTTRASLPTSGFSQKTKPERKGRVQLIDASNICHKLRKALGNKRNEINPEDRAVITKLYSDFLEGENVKIYKNSEFIYREYAVMQPLQRSYAITDERIAAMLSKGSLSSLYDEAKVIELENVEEPTVKDIKKLDDYKKASVFMIRLSVL